MASWLILTVCFGGVALIAWHNHVKHRDAGGGWRYVYWQPFRIWGTIIGVAFFVLMGVVMAWIGPIGAH